MPLGSNFRLKQLWDSVIERCKSRLTEWKIKYLSTGARITLIKSVLSSLPTYFLSLFSAPVSILKEMERMQRNFLWGRSEGVFKHNLVDWKVVCQPIQAGGAGIRQLKTQNEALLGKWLWRFSHEEASLWKRLIKAKYGEEQGGWITAEGNHCYKGSLWNKIRRNWPIFVSCLTWQVGRGERIMFWKHPWLRQGCLCDAFPDIFAIARDKNALVADYCTGSGFNSVWNIQLRRNLNDWEWDSYYSIMGLLYSLPRIDTTDSLAWNQTTHRDFTVSSYYTFLQNGEKDVFDWKKLWKAQVPTRVTFFSWCALRGRILTMDNLKRRGHHLVNRCYFCQNQEETIEHLLIHCTWTTEIWSLILSCFGIQMCFPAKLKCFLLAWWGQSMGKRKKRIWNLIPYCLFWLLWKERNRRIFENEERTILTSKSLFLSCLYSWVEEGREKDLTSFLHFIASMK